MGIPSFFSHLVKDHPDCIKEITNERHIDNLYLDSNSIIYDCVHKLAEQYENDVSFEDMLLESVLAKITDYVTTLRPTKRCMVAFDGVAPVAKLNQQRNRRYKSMIEGMIDDKLSGYEKRSWNTAAITPGTGFMKKLMGYLREKLQTHEYRDAFIFSGSDEAGEGEHKIFEFIRRNQCSSFSKETHVIYGLDADLIMLTLNHLYVSENISLFRETPHFISHIDSSLEPDKLYCLDIPFLAETIAHEMGKYRVIDRKHRFIINDYIFLCFILGNDFMPHFPSINIRTNGIDILLETYKTVIGTTRYFLTNNEKINWNQVRRLFMELRKSETLYLKKEHKNREQYESRELPTETFEQQKYKYLLLPTKRREIEKFIDPGSRGWESRYYSSLCGITNSESNIKRICINYIEALEWTLHYYVKGCKNWRWSYNYSYPPLICDLCKFLPCFESQFVASTEQAPVDTLVQLSYVMPRQSLHLLGNDISHNLLTEFPEQYRLDYTQKWSYCKYIWESHVDLPYFSIESLEKTLVV